MKPQNKIVAATVAIGVALYAGADYLIERLGYFSSLALLLPKPWLTSMQTEPYLLIGCAVLLAIAIGLLWSVAFNVARSEKRSRTSNEKAWAFDAEFTGLREDYQAIRRNQEELLAEFRKVLQKLDLLEKDRERTFAEIRTHNEAAVTTAVTTAVNQAAEQMRQHRDRTALELQTRVDGLRGEIENSAHVLRQEFAEMSAAAAAAEVSRALAERD